MAVRLLIVDDEPPVLQVLKATLEPLGAEVVAVTSSQKAAEYVEQQKFDGLIIDVRMPPPDGFELAKRARASSLNNKVPIVMLTGYDDAETMREGFCAGATCFLGKPVTRDRIQNLFHAVHGPLLAERRRNARVPYRTKVVCKWGPYGEKQFVAESLNLGEGGMLLQPSGGLDTNQEVLLEFAMPTADRPLRMRSKVVRREAPDRMAVEFLGRTASDQEAILQYIIGRVQG
jgi:CheY-like chemotaxis protein